MKCQFCGKEIEGKPLDALRMIAAEEHYIPTFFLRFYVDVDAKDGHGIVRAQLCKHCMKELYTTLGKELEEDN